MRKMFIRKAPLQAADTNYAGWLYLSTEALDPDETATRINKYIKRECDVRGRPAFVIVCECRMIWDDRVTAKNTPIKERNAKKAMHIVCEKGRANDTATLVREWLCSPRFKAFTNLPMKFIPNFTRGNGSVYNMKFSRAVQKHMQLTAFGTRHMLCSDFQNLDCPTNDMMKGTPALCKLILAMVQTRPSPPTTAGATTPGSTGPLFLSVDAATRHSDRGSYLVTYKVDNAVEAEEKLKHLLSYFIHDHGDSSTLWFLPTAIEQADGMKWDAINDRPISAFEEELDGILDDDDLDWVANLEEADRTFKAATVEVSLKRPSLLSKVSNNPFNG